MATSRWAALEELQTGAVERWAGENLRRCDPYLVWADAITSPSDGTALDIAVLVELNGTGNAYLDFLKSMSLGAAHPSLPGFLPNGFEPAGATRFITGFVNRPGLAWLVRQVVKGGIGRFSIQNSRADIAAATQVRWSHVEDAMKPRNMCDVLCKDAEGSAAADAATHTGTYLGIIDDGLPFLRLPAPRAQLWDQGWRRPNLPDTQGTEPPDPDDPFWKAAWEAQPQASKPRGFLYGRRLKEPKTGGVDPRKGNDRDDYLGSRYGAPSPRKTHGAGVLGLMAPWVSGARAEVDWPEHISGLAMVQLPTSTVLDTSGGSLAMRVLDGLRYVLWQEELGRKGHPAPRPVAVNISYGVHAGPHDGTSIFERALAELLEHHPLLNVVLPAGNAAQAECHARREIDAEGSVTLQLEVLPDNGRETFVELWMPKGCTLRLGVRPPGSAEPVYVKQDEAKIHFDPDPADANLPATVHFGVVYAKEVALGTEGSMALLAIGPTRRTPRPVCLCAPNQQLRRECLAAPGLWQLTIENLTTSKVTLDAWIERDDAPPDRAVGNRQARFLDASPEGTLNGIATLRHDRLHVVGAMRVDGVLSDYSAAGPGRIPEALEGPKSVAPADWSRNLPGLKTTGFLRGVVARLNGTSAACAVFTRALAEKLAGLPPPAEGPPPGKTPREMPSGPRRKKQAGQQLRGQQKRGRFRYEVEL